MDFKVKASFYYSKISWKRFEQSIYWHAETNSQVFAIAFKNMILC